MTENRFIRAVAELARKTQDEEIRWNLISEDEKITLGFFGKVVNIYKCRQGDKLLRLYQTDSGTSYPEDDLVLEYCDLDNRTLFTFPHVGPLTALWDAVQRQTSGIEEFLDSLVAHA